MARLVSNIHALLCRSYGRDWYDFLWYAKKGVIPNFHLLSNAIDQQGPWAGQHIQVTPTWYIDNLESKIKSINWEAAKKDVFPFLKKPEKKTLALWGIDFFMDKLEKLENALSTGA